MPERPVPELDQLLRLGPLGGQCPVRWYTLSMQLGLPEGVDEVALANAIFTAVVGAVPVAPYQLHYMDDVVFVRRRWWQRVWRAIARKEP